MSLFERGNRGLTLTPAGEILAREADGIFRREQDLLRRLRSASVIVRRLFRKFWQ